MDNFTINKILNSNHQLNNLKKQKIFIGVYPRDKIPKIKSYPSCFILNTDTSTEPGEHWLAVYVDQNNECYFFDSYGNSPKFFGLDNYFSQFKTLTWNKIKLQGNSNNCGLYCILFLLYKSHNKLQQFYLEFDNKSDINDKKLIDLIKIIN
jgi:hypothetical protein